MTRIFTLILTLMLVYSCSNELEFNTPTIQGTKNYELWITQSYQATISENGSILIVGANGDESVRISIENFEEGVYNLGESNDNTIVFEDELFKSYSTQNNGNGEIVVTEYDAVNLTISGSFMFNSYSTDGDMVNFNHGVFHKIPIISNVTQDFVASSMFNAHVDSTSNDVDAVEVINFEEYIKVKATYVNNTFIEINFPKNIQMGSYTLNASSEIYANYVDDEGVVASSQYGTLTIVEHNTQFREIKGNFLFNTGHPYNVAVTNGNFIVYY